MSAFWIIVPVKDTSLSKQRLSDLLSADQRRKLAHVMLEDVLEAIAPLRDRAPCALVTIDAFAEACAARYGMRTITDGAHDGHTGAVDGAGFLEHFPETGRYLGGLSLDILSVGIDALVILPMGLAFIIQSFVAQLVGAGQRSATPRFAWYGLGIAGIAIGFAAKDTLENLIAGVTILLDRPLRDIQEEYGLVREPVELGQIEAMPELLRTAA